MQYTEDFKRGIVRTLLASGMTRKEFAAKTKITVQALRKQVKQYKDEEIKNVDHNNRSKYSEEYKKSIVSKMLFDGITYETMSKKTGISSQLLEYWDNKYRYILIDEFEKRMANRRKKKVKKETRWHRYGAGAGRYEQEKMEECKLQFNISGEWITGLVREWFYLEGKGYDKCIEILNDCMSGTDETKEQIRRHAEDVLLGRAALKGNTADGSYHLEIYSPEHQEKMPHDMNVWEIVGEQKKIKDELEQYKRRWKVAMKMIPRYLKEEIGNELDEDLTATSPTVSRTLDSYMKRMLDTEEHTTEDYGWLEPSGKFHAVEWGEHQKWAYEYLKRSSTEEKMPVLYEAGDVLTKKGWVLLHNPAQGVAMATINPRRDYTKAQKEFLFSYYMERNCEKEANEIWRE